MDRYIQVRPNRVGSLVLLKSISCCWVDHQWEAIWWWSVLKKTQNFQYKTSDLNAFSALHSNVNWAPFTIQFYCAMKVRPLKRVYTAACRWNAVSAQKNNPKCDSWLSDSSSGNRLIMIILWPISCEAWIYTDVNWLVKEIMRMCRVIIEISFVKKENDFIILCSGIVVMIHTRKCF